MRDYLKNNDISIKSGADVNSTMRDIKMLLTKKLPDRQQQIKAADIWPFSGISWIC